ncbi:hypothetical protein [Flavobacterium panacagri]|uniref:hypothetical protein n=1 Tax=Flavobacterium panacagri TaxID=3034146 RepID=UPI0025A54984|nr:hypothetical protein [Flavobacterium panacagri]
MKLFKKVALIIVTIIVLSLFGGYFYFQKKFTPPENYLNVSGIAENIPLKWISGNENQHEALLIPVQIDGIDKIFYMQFDSDSPITVFYKKSLASISEKFLNAIKMDSAKKQISTGFTIRNMKINSAVFQLLNYGSVIDFDNPDAENIVGTIGTDLLEKRVTILDFKNSKCSFLEQISEENFTAFEFKKRKILIPSKIENQDLKLLFDTGTSGYELITQKEIWEKYKIKNSPIKAEKGNSWENTLDVYSASAKKKIQFGNLVLNLSEVTYIEGTSDLQKFLMKRSGMQGMIGNKLFLQHKLILDCKTEKYKLE